MRIAMLAAVIGLLAGAASAQTTRTAPIQPTPHPGTGSGQEPTRTDSEARSPRAPLDLGPSTPDANQAHRGGGAILEGAPGAPAPPPMWTPPRDPR